MSHDLVRKFFLQSLAMMLSSAGLSGVSATTSMTPSIMPAHAQVDKVQIVKRSIDRGILSEAVVEAVKQSTVAAQIAGRVIEVRVDAGQSVKAGQVLMRLDAREVAGVNQAAVATQNEARAAFERAKRLFDQKFISKASLDQAEAAWKASMGSATASGATLSHAAVTSPLTGVIAQRHVELGEMAAPGRALVTVFDPKSLRVIATVSQSALAEVTQRGRAWVEFPESGRRIEAARMEILPTVDAKSHTATIRVYLPATIAGVTPGMAARVHFSAQSAEKLTVPGKAIIRRGEITAVYVLGEKGNVQLRQVRLGEPGADGEVEVLAGIHAGEWVSLDPMKVGIGLKTPKH